MTRRGTIVCSFLLAVSLLALWLAPRLLSLDEVRQRIAHEASLRLDARVTLGGIGWAWLPTPHIRLNGGMIERPDLDAALPAVSLYPDWGALFGGRCRLSRLVVYNPALSVRQQHGPAPTWAGLGGLGASLAGLPVDQVTVVDGNLLWYGEASSGITPGPREFAHTNMRADLSAAPSSLQLSCRPPFGESLSAKGHFDPQTGAYDFKVALGRLRLHEVPLPAAVPGLLRPVDSEINLDASLAGQGTEKWHASLTGDFPRLVLAVAGREAPLSCRAAELEVERSGARLTVRVGRLAFTEPRLRLEGLAEVTSGSASAQGAAPLGLRLDLTAHDVDLDAMRERVLALWGDHHITQEVCAIVRGGEARAARFLFEGPATGLSDLAAMTITADVKSASIHCPEVDLDLEEASGPIRIEHGVLTGEGLATRLGGSRGWDGRLVLGLLGEDRPFSLDVQIETDLAELPPLLERLVPHPVFRRELSLLSEVKGQAQGQLILGERLKNVDVRVKVASVEGSARYRRLPWPIAVSQGQCTVEPERVAWSGVSGVVGPHGIRETSGQVSVGPGSRLTVGSLLAELDAASLNAELLRHRSIGAPLARILTSAQGRVEVQAFTLEGPSGSPRDWQYRFQAAAGGLGFTSPMLPGPVVLHRAKVDVSDTEINILQCEASVAGEPLALAGRLRPPERGLGRFGPLAPVASGPEGVREERRGWQGLLEITGRIDGGIATWLKEKGWIPEPFFPRTPCQLRGLRVAWGGEGVSLRGGLFPLTEEAVGGATAPAARPLPEAAGASVFLDVHARQGHLAIRTLRIEGPKEQAVLSLDADTEAGRLNVAWDGDLTGETLDRVLARNTIFRGRLSGSWAFRYCRTGPHETRISGILEAHDLFWPWGLPRPITIDRLLLSGRDDAAAVEALLRLPGKEKMRIQGEVHAGPTGLGVNLDVHTPAMSWETVAGAVAGALGKGPDVTERSQEGRPPWPVAGEVRFEIGEFSYTHPVSPTEKGPQRVYVFSPMAGRLSLVSPRALEFEVTRARLCDLTATGVWRQGPEEREVRLRIATEGTGKVRFESLLQCLGYRQDVIRGEALVDVRLEGAPKDWRSGRVEIHSDSGRIHRLTLLSKLFSVLNVLDLFSGSLPDLMKEGFGYSRLDLEGDVEKNRLQVEAAVVRGEGLNLFGQGSVNMGTWDLDLTVLVAPFKTMDAVIQRVPLVGGVIGGETGTLMTIPVGVSGRIADPKIRVLPPEAVGEGLMGLVKRTLGLPLKILRPVLPQTSPSPKTTGQGR